MAETTRRNTYLEALKKPSDPRPFITFDLESKNDDTQEPGFTRPFLVGAYDGATFRAFRNDPCVDSLPWQDRATAPGGCIDQFMRWVLGDSQSGCQNTNFKNHDVYAHNMGAFDGLFLPAWLQRNARKYSFKVMPVQARIMSMEVWRHVPNRQRATEAQRRKADQRDRKAHGVWRFLDSFKVLPIGLDKLIKMFALNQGEGKLKFDLATHEDDPGWEEYNEVDVAMLWKVVEKYQALVRTMGGDVGVTAPSTAVKLLRHRYLGDRKIHRNLHWPTCQWHPDQPVEPDEDATPCLGCAHEFFRSAYFGGRTEIYTQSGSGLTYYDVNSSYPASMKMPQPIGPLTELGENESFVEIASAGKHIGFVRCTIEIPEDVYLPPLPIQLDGKLCFPCGRFSGTWDWDELKTLAQVGGKILHVERSGWIEAGTFLNDFIDSLYAMRKKGSPDYDEGRSEVAKLMMNSTFGKFGMDPNRLEVVILKPREDVPRSTRNPRESRTAYAKRRVAEREIEKKTRLDAARGLRLPQIDDAPSALFEHASLVRYRDTRIDAAYIIPQIACHITALSRVRLWSYSMEFIRRGGRIYYSDTDSIVTDIGDRPDETHLGGLKKEHGGKDIIDLYCYAPKMYWIRRTLPEGTPFSGTHEKDENGNRTCAKECKGCGRTKVMMKGIPRDMKTIETMDELSSGKTIRFRQLEKFGALARADLQRTPAMIEISKSMHLRYDKRILDPVTGETKPQVISDPGYLSEKFRSLPSTYVTPGWLMSIFDA